MYEYNLIIEGKRRDRERIEFIVRRATWWNVRHRNKAYRKEEEFAKYWVISAEEQPKVMSPQQATRLRELISKSSGGIKVY